MDFSKRYYDRMAGRLLLSFLLSIALMVSFPPSLRAEISMESSATHTIYFAQMADGGGYRSEIVLTNPGAREATVTLEAFAPDGSPLAVTLDSTTDTKFTWKVRSLQTLSLKSPGSGKQVTRGWIRIRSTRPLSSSLLYNYLPKGWAPAEAGMIPSVPTSQFLFQVDTRRGYGNGVVVANPNDTAVDIQYSLHDADGKLKASADQHLDGMKQTARMLEEIFPEQDLKDFTGIVIASSTGGSVIAVTLRFDAEMSTFASLPVTTGMDIAEKASADYTTYFAHMQIGSNDVSEIVLTNPGATEATVSLEAFASDGSAVSVTLNSATDTKFTFKIQSLQTLSLRSSLPKGGQSVDGWMRVKSTRPLSSHLLYSRGFSKVESEEEMIPSVPTSQFLFPMDSRQGSAMLTIANPNSTAVDIRYSLYGANGVLKDRVSQRLEGMKQTTLGNWGFFSEQVGYIRFNGIVIASSTGGPVIAIISKSTGVDLSSLPVTTGTYIAEDKSGRLYAVDPIVGNLRFVPPGTFQQGESAEEIFSSSWYAQPFFHTLTRNLAVMETEVSRKMWADLKAIQPSLPDDPSTHTVMDTLPVDGASWLEAILYANLLSLQQGLKRVYYTDPGFTTPIDASNYRSDGYGRQLYQNLDAGGYRLPTEGEWEYFTRAGTTSPFSIVEPYYYPTYPYNCILFKLNTVAWFNCNSSYESHPVGIKTANPWGLKDVHGNMEEWCWDLFNYYPVGLQTDYIGPAQGSDYLDMRVVRGGNFGLHIFGLLSSYREKRLPDAKGEQTGFRLVRTLPAGSLKPGF